MSTKPYPSYKDSGVEWLGRIPEHWRTKRIKHLAFLRSGDAITSEEIRESGDYPVFGGNGIRGYSSRWNLKGNHVLIGRQGALCGNINYATGECWVSEHAIVAHLHGADNFMWFGELLRSMNLNQYSQSAAQPGLAADLISNLAVSVPPTSEQELIATFLDQETGKIDALVKKKERLIELLQEKRTALISHAVTQGLNPNAPKKDSGIAWFGYIPKHWECGRLKVRLKKVGQGWSPLCENRPAQAGEWGVLKVGCMNSSIYDEAENKSLPIEIEPAKELEIRVGDVLMSRSNTVELVGSVGIVHETQGKILLCDKLFRLVFDQTKLLPEYAVSLLRSPVARKQIEAASSGASPSMKNISNGAVSGLVLPFPPVDEQQVILKRILDQTTKLDALMAKVRTAIERLQEYRTALISAAVTGQIDVRGGV